MKAYIKPHISETVVIAIVGMSFEDSSENGGEDIKLVFQISQGTNVIQSKLVGKNGVVINK